MVKVPKMCVSSICAGGKLSVFPWPVMTAVFPIPSSNGTEGRQDMYFLLLNKLGSVADNEHLKMTKPAFSKLLRSRKCWERRQVKLYSVELMKIIEGKNRGAGPGVRLSCTAVPVASRASPLSRWHEPAERRTFPNMEHLTLLETSGKTSCEVLRACVTSTVWMTSWARKPSLLQQ